LLRRWVERLPPDLLASAYRAEQTAEAAWPRPQALLVLESLARLRIPVVGVEVWIATTPGPTIPTQPYYGISIDTTDRLDEEAVNESIRQAAQFVAGFKWLESDERHRALQPYFNFTADAD
jgi:hypothetical protein